MKTIVSGVLLYIFVIKIGLLQATVNEASIVLECENKSIYQ